MIIDVETQVDLADYHDLVMDYVKECEAYDALFSDEPETDSDWEELVDAFQIFGRDKFIELAREKLTKRLNRVVEL